MCIRDSSDLGARLLVLNARHLLPHFIGAADATEHQTRHWRLGRRIVRRAARQAREMGLDDGVLDATLLIAWCDGATIHIHPVSYTHLDVYKRQAIA